MTETLITIQEAEPEKSNEIKKIEGGHQSIGDLMMSKVFDYSSLTIGVGAGMSAQFSFQKASQPTIDGLLFLSAIPIIAIGFPAVSAYFMTSGIRERREELRAIENYKMGIVEDKTEESSIKKFFRVIRSLYSKRYYERNNPLNIPLEVYENIERYFTCKVSRNNLIAIGAFTAPDILTKPDNIRIASLGLVTLAYAVTGITNEILGNIRRKNLEKMMEEEVKI